MQAWEIKISLKVICFRKTEKSLCYVNVSRNGCSFPIYLLILFIRGTFNRQRLLVICINIIQFLRLLHNRRLLTISKLTSINIIFMNKCINKFIIMIRSLDGKSNNKADPIYETILYLLALKMSPINLFLVFVMDEHLWSFLIKKPPSSNERSVNATCLFVEETDYESASSKGVLITSLHRAHFALILRNPAATDHKEPLKGSGSAATMSKIRLFWTLCRNSFSFLFIPNGFVYVDHCFPAFEHLQHFSSCYALKLFGSVWRSIH